MLDAGVSVKIGWLNITLSNKIGQCVITTRVAIRLGPVQVMLAIQAGKYLCVKLLLLLMEFLLLLNIFHKLHLIGCLFNRLIGPGAGLAHLLHSSDTHGCLLAIYRTVDLHIGSASSICFVYPWRNLSRNLRSTWEKGT